MPAACRLYPRVQTYRCGAANQRDGPIGDMFAKARIRASGHWKAQWSFACARKKTVGGEPFAGGPRQTTAVVANGGASRADRATPIEVAHADRQNPPGPSRARFAAVDGGRRCCGAV